jgi:adenine-specific DNA-methyltransferase
MKMCILMTTDPGDLVLDPTCGSGTTATVAEQWGRRWITIDTSRVALALARARIMGARYPFYLLADSREGQIKEAEVTRNAPSSQPVHGNIRHGFVYERVPHITLKVHRQQRRDRCHLGQVAGQAGAIAREAERRAQETWQEWEIPREADAKWPDPRQEAARRLVAGPHRPAAGDRSKSIAAKAEFDTSTTSPTRTRRRCAWPGPFTVESLRPHRVLGVDENDELIDTAKRKKSRIRVRSRLCADDPGKPQDRRRAAGAQGRPISFTSLTPWPGDLVCAEGRYMEGDKEKRAAIFIGPEFGTVQRPDLVKPPARPATRLRRADRLRLQLRRTPPSSTSSAASRC